MGSAERLEVGDWAEVVQLGPGNLSPGQIWVKLAKVLMVSFWDPSVRHRLQTPPADAVHPGPTIP